MASDVSQGNLFGRVIALPIEDEIKQSYLDYAMSVIVGRALPDARDGLKPVQRRILFAMLELGLRHNQSYKKSARVVGETMGKYHPHGDSAIYDTMARMSQDFSMRYPLVDGQGNFGSIDGDPPAAMRYTEARLENAGEQMLSDIDEQTVAWGPNFDESLEEPLVLPNRIPNLLINGSTGIAVGMATNMPPHNVGEVIAACVAVLENPDIELGELMTLIPGPDFPTGGIILGKEGIIDAYRTGRGKVIMRGMCDIEDGKKGKKVIIIREIPYMVNKTTLLETIVKGVHSQAIDGITDLRDETNREGIRVVLELHKDADPNLVLRQLYTRTQLQSTFGVINLALVNKRPVELPLINLIKIFLEHRKDVVLRRTAFRLKKAEDRAHIVEGLLKAIAIIETAIALIRAAKDAATAKAALIEQHGFSETQAQAVLEMRLQRLTGLEREKLEAELAQLNKDIAYYKSILENEIILKGIIKGELEEAGKAFNDPRRTVIEQDEADDTAKEDLIPESEIVVVLSRDGYIRRMPLQDYHTQLRGGKGVKKAVPKGEDEIALLAVTTTHRTLFMFTSKGRVFAIRGLVLPEPKTGKGKHVGSYVSLEDDERVVALKDDRLETTGYVFFVTRYGIAKRLPVEELKGINRAGRRVLGLVGDDAIARVRITNGNNELLLTTALGQTLRVSEEEFRPQGRAARGVKGIRLGAGDSVVGCDVITPGRQVLFVSEHGVGKRTNYGDFTQYHRGSGGVKTMRLTERTGILVGAWGVGEDDELVVVSAKGRVVRVNASEISSLSRTATGNAVVRLDEGDLVADVTIIYAQEE